ncbi:MAG: DNA-processing protein DprA, partial [Planctomycetota bacterium]|nr:DNA-processing protein DprA [Planctomycetota bacterium]
MAELTENLLLLKDAPGVGNTIVWRLLKEFGSADGVFGASAEALTRVRGVTLEKAAGILEAGRRDPRPELEKAAEAGINVIPYDDPSYPKPLLHSFDPPVILYVRGALADEDQVAVGIVGTRQATPYGRERALELSAALARGGYTVVSGLARGIDTFAHIGALNAGGRTAGVLGCGFSHMYPEENRDLALEMSRNGVVISEFSMDTRPSRETFPARNRFIAGLSLGLLVIEAPLRSGSLITARLANENGRVVFAVPGRVGDPGSEGCNKLIRDGAVMVTGPD